jgi:hypothetical protein
LRAAGARHDAKRDLGQTEASGRARIGKIAGQDQFAAAAECRPVHGRYHRDRAVEQGERHALEQRVLLHPLRVGHAVALFQVAAGAERLVAGAGQDHAAIVLRVVDQPREHVMQIVADLGRDRVAHLGPVDAHGEHMLARLLQREGLVFQILHEAAFCGVATFASERMSLCSPSVGAEKR